MKKSRFSKNCQITGLPCTPDFAYCFFELVSYSFQGERGKYINSGRISWLWIPAQTLNFPPSCPDYPWCNYDRKLLYPGHNYWDACEVFLPFPFNVDLEDVYAQVNAWNQHWGKGGKQYLYSWDKVTLCFSEVFQQIMTAIVARARPDDDDD